MTAAPGKAALIHAPYITTIISPQDLQVAGIPGLNNAFLRIVTPDFLQ